MSETENNGIVQKAEAKNAKVKNLITRSITGVLFVAVVVTSFMRPEGMIFLFALVTGLTVWEYTGLVNEIRNVSVNRSGRLPVSCRSRIL